MAEQARWTYDTGFAGYEVTVTDEEIRLDIDAHRYESYSCTLREYLKPTSGAGKDMRARIAVNLPAVIGTEIAQEVSMRSK